MTKKMIIIDTDPGIDDAMAIVLAVNSELFDIKYITTVCGNSTIENTTANASFILDFLDSKDIPICQGESKPLRRSGVFASVHGRNGLGKINVKKPINIAKDSAVKIILQTISRYPNQITIVALGPLTNIATAIMKDQKIMKQVKEIVIMGGAISVPGNMNRVAEFNIFFDPEAADIVFKFPIRKLLVPLDICNLVTITNEEFNEIKNNRMKEFILKLADTYISQLSKVDGIQSAVMYDPVTIYATLFPKMIKTERMDIVVETQGQLTRGMTVAEKRKNRSFISDIEIVSEIDINNFKKFFIETLSKSKL